MDIYCACCGEPWDVDYVLHDEPTDFRREGCLISACPACNGIRPADMSAARRRFLLDVHIAAVLLGDDIDGFAALLEDMQFWRG